MPCDPEMTGLTERSNDPLKTQLCHHLDQNALKGWDSGAQKVTYALNQKQIYGVASSIARTHESRIQGEEVKVVATLTTTPNIQLTEY